MIVFNGYLFGAAEKHYFKKGRIFGQNIMLFSTLLFFPLIVMFSVRTQNYGILLAYSSLFVVIPLAAMIPQSKKTKKALTPKKIFINDGYIVCVADKFTESRLLTDVKQVNNYDEFYELVFPFGKVSDKFICQKSLLSQGTLEEFESIFKQQGTIIKEKKTVQRQKYR